MARILIVDDEPHYRQELTLALYSSDHEVKTASSGREAIDVGTCFRPDVLVTDWLLDNHIHGLHVSEVLRAVDPDVQTVLITGFGTSDLRTEAEHLQVFDYIEKPFGVDRFEDAVRNALVGQPQAAEGLSIAVIHADTEEAIVFANRRAQDLLGGIRAGAAAKDLAALLGNQATELCEQAAERWVKVPSPTIPPQVWHLRARECSDPRGYLLVLLTEREERHKNHPVVRMMLGAAEAPPETWTSSSRVLVVDDYELIRRVVVGELERVGCICHAAPDGELALRLFKRDESILYVVLDHNIPGTDVAKLVREFRRIRPEVVIVGNSGESRRRDDFAAMGVTLFLQKPWRVGDLVNQLTGRIGNCAECGLPLPLRRTETDEATKLWVCTFCGARYQGVLDDSLPADLRENVRPADLA